MAEFTAAWNQLQAETSAGLTARRQELARVRATDRADGGRHRGRHAGGEPARAAAALEARKVALGAELDSAEAPAPRLHPRFAGVYQERGVPQLSSALAAEDAVEGQELIRGLVKETPDALSRLASAGASPHSGRGA